ncbi:hypothetical protein O181_048344 [Austropuccinia psidii MF-1]|uniref:Tet-like 2OG-Fe(II) oxygenase domain-containing protein n=1 Tax=Austropuccinia psidii MF-1 TaxID=1389203 RepID=A0A9Q3HMW1_9BASI|nr:hypothetical protein [Austropuccinia psidii MF-1]
MRWLILNTGVYAFKKGLTPEQLQEDTINHEKLSSFNNFIFNRIAEFTQVAPASNSRLILDASLPSWHESQWPLAAIEDKQIFSSVIITHNGFHNEIHVDQHDVNPWTYGFFSFINADTFECLQSPHNTFQHGLFFPNHNFLLDFAKSNGIIEVLWKTSKIKHQTTPPLLILKNYPSISHFGASFQISKALFTQGHNLKYSDPSIIMTKTFSQHERIMKYDKKQKLKD